MKSQKALFLSPLAVVASFALLVSLHPLAPSLRGADDPPAKKTLTVAGGFKFESTKTTAMVGTTKVIARTITTKAAVTVGMTKAMGDKYGEKKIIGDVAFEKNGDRTQGATKASLGFGFKIEK